MRMDEVIGLNKLMASTHLPMGQNLVEEGSQVMPGPVGWVSVRYNLMKENYAHHGG